MTKTYRILAFVIAAEVVVQAAAIAWAMFGFANWIDDGNTFSKKDLDCKSCGFSFTEERGFMIHGINGQMIIPLLALALLVVAFLAKVPGGVTWALVVFGLVLVQAVLLPVLAEDVNAVFGALHGLNALVLFGCAVTAGIRTRKAEVVVGSAA